MPLLTILTPSYNRLVTLKRLLNSLRLQTCKNFQWLVIDDGSNDGTEKWFENLELNSFNFQIDYFRKENGGKHTAINYAYPYIKGDYVVIIDSDDFLVKNAVKIILFYWQKYSVNRKIGGITFQRGKRKNQQKYDKNFTGTKVSTVIEMMNNGMIGDHCETFRTSVFTKKRFPVFNNEKFVAEGAMWYLLTKDYQVAYVDKVVCLAEYLNNGLTKSGRRLRISNPQGSRWHAGVFLNDKKIRFKIRFKNSILYDTYTHFIGDQLTDILKKENHSYCLIVLNWLPSFILYLYWKTKYCGDKD